MHYARSVRGIVVVTLFVMVAVGAVVLLAVQRDTAEAEPDRRLSLVPPARADEELETVRASRADRHDALVRERRVVIYTTAVQTIAVEQAAAAEAARLEAEARERAEAESEVESAAVQGSGACGGDLPDCSIMECESGGNLTAQNPSSSASGKWQFIDGTWNNYGGYPTAADAPEDVQDAKAREVWAGGAGAGHWEQCR